MVKKEYDREEYARGWLLPNARWSGIATDCEGQRRRGDDVIGVEDLQRASIKWRHDSRDRNGHLPTKREINTTTPTSEVGE